MRGRVRQLRHERQELGEATWDALAAGLIGAQMLIRRSRPGSAELVQLQVQCRAEAVRLVLQQVLQITRALVPSRPAPPATAHRSAPAGRKGPPRSPRHRTVSPAAGCPIASHPALPYGIQRRQFRPAGRRRRAQPHYKLRPWRKLPLPRHGRRRRDRPALFRTQVQRTVSSHDHAETQSDGSRQLYRYAAQTTFREGRTLTPAGSPTANVHCQTGTCSHSMQITTSLVGTCGHRRRRMPLPGCPRMAAFIRVRLGAARHAGQRVQFGDTSAVSGRADPEQRQAFRSPVSASAVRPSASSAPGQTRQRAPPGAMPCRGQFQAEGMPRPGRGRRGSCSARSGSR